MRGGKGGWVRQRGGTEGKTQGRGEGSGKGKQRTNLSC